MRCAPLAPPSWVSVVAINEPDDAQLLRLGRGERQAIALASDRRAELLLMDDRAARRVAISRGLVLTGTLGVLRNAAHEGLVDFAKSVDSLGALGFRMTQALIDEVLHGDV